MKIIKYMFFLLLINLFIIRVYAKSFEVNVDKNEIDVNTGEIVDILVNVQDIDITGGINAIEGFIKYDDDVIENMTFIGKNDWDIKHNSNKDSHLYGKFLLVKNTDGIKDAEDLMLIRFKVKNSVNKKRSIITLNDIFSNDGNELIKTKDKSIILNIKNANNPNTQDNIIKHVLIGLSSFIFLIIVVLIKKGVGRHE